MNHFDGDTPVTSHESRTALWRQMLAGQLAEDSELRTSTWSRDGNNLIQKVLSRYEVLADEEKQSFSEAVAALIKDYAQLPGEQFTQLPHYGHDLLYVAGAIESQASLHSISQLVKRPESAALSVLDGLERETNLRGEAVWVVTSILTNQSVREPYQGMYEVALLPGNAQETVRNALFGLALLFPDTDPAILAVSQQTLSPQDYSQVLDEVQTWRSEPML